MSRVVLAVLAVALIGSVALGQSDKEVPTSVAEGAQFLSDLKPEAAIEAFLAVSPQDPHYASAATGLVIARLMLKQTDEALAKLDELCRRFPDRSEYPKSSGIVLASQGDARGAIPALQRAHELSPQDHECAYLLAGCYVTMAAQALTENPSDAMSARLLEQAIQHGSMAIDGDGGDHRYLRVRGYALFLLKRYSESVRDLEQSIKAGPRDLRQHYSRVLAGFCLMAAQDALENPGDGPSSSWYIEKALVASPYWWRLYSFRGAMRVRAGTDRALCSGIADFTTAISLEPNEHEPYLRRAHALLAQTRLSEAARDIERAFQLCESPSVAMFRTRAGVNTYLDKYDLVEQDCTTALNVSPEPEVDMLFLRAFARERLGQSEAAERDRAQARELLEANLPPAVPQHQLEAWRRVASEEKRNTEFVFFPVGLEMAIPFLHQQLTSGME